MPGETLILSLESVEADTASGPVEPTYGAKFEATIQGVGPEFSLRLERNDTIVNAWFAK
jgi:hypothetical protein